MMEHRFLDKKSLALLLGMSVSSINRRIKEGVAPFSQCVRIGRLVRWNRTLFENLGLDPQPLAGNSKGGRDE